MLGPFTDLDNIADLAEYIAELIGANPNYYPWATLPPAGKSFDQVGTIALPAIGVETIVTTFTVPLGYDGFCQRISNNYLGPSFNPGLPSLIWRIRNGSSVVQSKFVDNYNSITVEYGTTNFPREISGIHISSAQRLIYTVTNNDPALPVGASQVTCCFSGSIWPQQRDATAIVRKGKRR